MGTFSMFEALYSTWVLVAILFVAVVSLLYDFWLRHEKQQPDDHTVPSGTSWRKRAKATARGLAIACGCISLVLTGLSDGLDLWLKLPGALSPSETVEQARSARYKDDGGSIEAAAKPQQVAVTASSPSLPQSNERREVSETTQTKPPETIAPDVQEPKLKKKEPKQTAAAPSKKKAEQSALPAPPQVLPEQQVALIAPQVQGWPPPAATAPGVSPEKASLAITIKSELKRLNCYRGPDGPEWDEDAVSAVNDFNAYGYRRIASVPDAKALSVLQSFSAPVCP